MSTVVWVLDSADRALMERWTADGSLPNIAALWKSSRVHAVGADGWFDEIGTWVTAYSGIPATRHGYHCARRLRPGSYSLERMRFADAAARPCWAQMAQPGFRALIWEPIESVPIPNLDGAQVYHLTAHQEAYAIEPAVSFPPDEIHEIHRRLNTRRRLRFDRFHRPLYYYKALLRDNLDLLERKSPIIRDLVRRGPYDLTVIGFNEIHDAGHLLWSFMDGKSPDRDPRGELADAVRTIYKRVDREIGEIMALQPPGTSCCLLSTYGMQDQYPSLGLMEDFMLRLGYQIPASRPPAKPTPLSLARRAIPEGLRYEISKHLPSATQQSLLFSSFTERTDFTRSRAFVVPTSLYSVQIRVNLQGREPSGIVSPGADYEGLVEELEAGLKCLIDPVTGEPAAARVVRTANHYIEGPSELLADIFVHWKRGTHFMERLIHPRAEIRQRVSGFHRESGHRIAGFAAVSGPGIEPVRGGEARLLDIAPTLLDLMQAKPDPSMPGTSLLPN